MGDPADAGKPAAFQGSMAEAIEDALNRLLQLDSMATFQTNDNSTPARDRRRVFVAIAQGIVNHLVANQEAFVIKEAANVTTTLKIDIQQS